MSEFQAGFHSFDITPQHMGFPLYGYSGRQGMSSGIHDPLTGKVIAVRQGNSAWAYCNLDLIAINAASVAEVRKQVAARTALKPDSILISCIHTHSGPSVGDAGNWDRPIVDIIADGIVQAWKNLAPAKIGVGAGFLYGYTINRRWFERPIDPGVGVMRVDHLDGRVMGVFANFGLHAVVLGYDNLLISADYVGYMKRFVEQELGGVCVFSNGGAGNVNPITETVKRQLAERRAFTTMTGAYYYGQKLDAIELADRIGGTFEEAEIIGRALADEIMYVARGIQTTAPSRPPWHAQEWVNHKVRGDEKVEIQALGISDFALIAEPGEVLIETALDLKEKLRSMGFVLPWVVSYANDWRSYLATEGARREGGYEAEMAKRAGHTPKLQQRLWKAIHQSISHSVPK